ncbi:MAG: ankyrin repeat domain-containing protein, partial [Bacteroidota bacterium]
GHSLDLVLAELAVVFLWFNPFVWILRKEVEKNLEYQTDHLLIANAEEVKESYQINLVKMATYTQPLNITTNYNQSLITQRILKMNTKKSNYFSYWKYAFLLPLLFVQLLLLNQPLAAKKPNESSARTNISDALRPNEMAITEIEPTESQITTPLQESGQTLTDTGQTSAYTLDLEQDASFVRDACGDLTRAIRAEDLAKVKKLIQSTDVNCVDPDPGYEVTVENEHGWTMRRSYPRTPLGMAARVGNLEIARLLVDAGAKIDFRAGGDATPLMEAAYEGHLSFVEYLSEQGAAINLRGGPYGAALSSAAANGQAKVVEYLLDSGANINIPGGAYGSALSSAANDGHVETVKLLINRGADLNINDGAYGTALNTAANNGHTEVVRTLLAAGANINAKGGAYGTALATAANNGHIETIEFLLNNGAEINATGGAYGTALNTAANNGHQEAVNLLLDRGAEADNAAGAYGTALNTAANNGHIETIRELLDQGADINATGGSYGTVLGTAANNGHVETIAFLIERGAD